MENLEALPHIIHSTRHFAGGKPYRVGPSAIGARDNPYGATATPNPQNGRVALARMDPRQRGLLGAAWNLGYVAHMARGGAEAVVLSAPVGEFGVVYARMGYDQPWFDQKGTGVYPVYHVLKGLAAAAGRPQLATDLSNGSAVQALAYRSDDRTVVWIANLTNAEQQLVLDDRSNAVGSHATLDLDSFTAAAGGSDILAATGDDGPIGRLRLGPYAVMRLELAA